MITVPRLQKSLMLRCLSCGPVSRLFFFLCVVLRWYTCATSLGYVVGELDVDLKEGRNSKTAAAFELNNSHLTFDDVATLVAGW